MRVNEIIELFQSKGVKATPQRISVYEALLSLKHPSAEAVLERVRSILPTVTVATVYNTLDCFAKAGVIERVLTVDNKMYRFMGIININWYNITSIFAYIFDTNLIIVFQNNK